MDSPEQTAELVRRCQAGDSSAFEDLYRTHVGQIYALCLRLSRDPQRATELTQDVFVRAWTGLASFRGEAAFSSWLYRVAVNVVRERQRGDSRRESRVELQLNLDHHAGPGAAVPTEERIDLERAIAELPPRARNAIVLHDIHGFRCREVAEMTGTAVGTIQAHLHRARKLLKEKLGR